MRNLMLCLLNLNVARQLDLDNFIKYIAQAKHAFSGGKAHNEKEFEVTVTEILWFKSQQVAAHPQKQQAETFSKALFQTIQLLNQQGHISLKVFMEHLDEETLA